MTSPIRFISLALGALGVLTTSALAHPIVPGFERFHSGPDANPAVGGALLLGELNCVSCHDDARAAKKQAPVLDGIASRARLGHLRKFIADPQAVKPGTTMPSLFAVDPDRNAKVEALVHFLAGTGSPRHVRPDLKAVIRGKDIYAKIGCAACHGGRDLAGDPAKPQFPFAVPLGDLKGKYTIPGLAGFLANPLETRPSGRMPHLLKPKQALDVANYLLQGTKFNHATGRGTTTFAYYEGGWDRLPDFSKMKPKAAGKTIAFEIAVAKHEFNFGLRFEGFFKADAAGAYTFHVASDDGSRLSIDGKTVVNNDGIHSTESKSGTIELTKGVHKVIVDFFQGGGEQVLEVEIEGRGLGRQPFGPLVAATEADLDKKIDPKPAAKDDDVLTIDQGLAAKGKTLFASIGCASCHHLDENKKPIASTLAAKPLSGQKAMAGCLAESPAKGLPKYELNSIQRKSLVAAIAKLPAGPREPRAIIARTMLTLNCYACHVRDKVGGPTELTSPVFSTTTPEMGEEARVPPPLNGVGAKLNPTYMSQILDKGADDRPYMHTSMPGFGKANVGHLVEAFGSIDKLPEVPPVKFDVPQSKVLSAGRHMVGVQGFGCIKCHTFAGNKAEGVQGIDMLLMTKRLKRDWFHAYCVDPQKIRPGTRMPTAWPAGQSTLPSILDGKAATQIEAIWTYLGSNNPAIPPGMGHKFIPLIPMDGAILYRNFIQGAGTRAIGVGYPEKVNLAFDANDLRLAMIWKGGFIDAARHWTDRGAGFEGPLGDDVVHLPMGAAFAVLDKSDMAWPTGKAREAGFRFLGYKLTKDDRPTFRYSFKGVTIEDFPNPAGTLANPNLKREFTLTSEKPVNGLFFRAAVGSKIEPTGGGWYKIDGLKVRIDGATPVVRQSNGRAELLVPLRLADGKAKFSEEFSW